MARLAVPTIKDIARKVGVSPSTVSRAINGSGYVSSEVRASIEAVIEKLGYRPNAIARSLRGERTYTVGVVVSDIANPFFMWFAKTIESVIGDHGYNVIVCSTEEDHEKELRYLHMLHEKRVDGIVLSTTGRNNEYISKLSQVIPVVLINQKHEDLPLDIIIVDGFQGAYLLTDHLIQKGHKRIALIKGSPVSATNNERCQGYCRAMTKAGLAIQSEYMYDGGRFGELATKVTKDILVMASPPTAILATSIMVAKGVIRAVNEEDKRIPDDISLVCFGLEEFSTTFRPAMTCIVLQPAMMGAKAGELIMQRIQNPSRPRTEVIFAPELYVGRSVKIID